MSQVTKPIALDETLQDVVTAIQGITQGGMIVSTGNVGSVSQPVYINGGVPTAGKDFAIKTGTPTNINTNLTLDGSNSRIQKSGNVVCFKLQFNISTTYTPSSVLDHVCTLPYKPVGWENVNRLIDTSGHGSAVMGQGFLSSAGNLCIGTSPYTGLTAGNEMVFTGTYMTND